MPRMSKRVVKKQYSALAIAKNYLKKYYRFIVDETDVVDDYEITGLFLYSVKRVLGFDSYENSPAVFEYGDLCVIRLSEVEGIPKRIKDLSLSDRTSILTVCEIYAKDTKILSKTVIEEGRLKKTNKEG